MLLLLPRTSTLFPYTTLFRSCKGCFNFATTDAWRDEARRTGRTMFASLAYAPAWANGGHTRSEEHTSELQSLTNLVCRLLLEKKKHTPHPLPTRDIGRRARPT